MKYRRSMECKMTIILINGVNKGFALKCDKYLQCIGIQTHDAGAYNIWNVESIKTKMSLLSRIGKSVTMISPHLKKIRQKFPCGSSTTLASWQVRNNYVFFVCLFFCYFFSFIFFNLFISGITTDLDEQRLSTFDTVFFFFFNATRFGRLILD